MPTKILLIDDDEKLGKLLKEFFQAHDLELLHLLHPHEGIKALEQTKFDLVLLDVMLPDINGFDVCRQIRKKSDQPIIMLSARGDVTDRVVGLEIGADDYVPKPFDPRELVARIHTVIRRSKTKSAQSEMEMLSFQDLKINLISRTVYLKNQIIDLTTLEFELLKLLTSHPGKVFSRDDIMTLLRGHDTEVFSRSVDILISRLRTKLEDKNQDRIKTIWGTGYCFVGGEK